MVDFITKALMIGFLCCIVIFIYTAFKFTTPDFYTLKIAVYCLMIFGIIKGIQHWND